MEELATVLSQFGVNVLWAVVLYKALDFVEFIGVILILSYAIKKAWPTFTKWLDSQ